MIDPREDQAAGLRRLFRRTPPTVAALYVTGRNRALIALQAAHRVAGGGQRVLLLDEAAGDDSLAGILGVPPGADLLHVLDGRVSLDTLVQAVPGLMGRVPVAAAALALPLLDDIRRERLLSALVTLQRHAGFVLVHAGAQAEDPSPFVAATPRRLLVAEATASGATDAYGLIKQLAAAGAGSIHLAVARARDRADARRFFAAMEALVRRHVGVPLAWLGEIERDDLAGPLSDAEPLVAGHAEAAFLRRLAALGRQPGRLAATWR